MRLKEAISSGRETGKGSNYHCEDSPLYLGRSLADEWKGGVKIERREESLAGWMIYVSLEAGESPNPRRRKTVKFCKHG